jgi:type IV pilus assembly protein PilX
MELIVLPDVGESGAVAPRRRKEQGVIIFVALIVLIVMTLTGLALMRQMGAGTSIAGNIAFKESATLVSDRGIEVARAWIDTPFQDTLDDALSVGYHSTWVGGVDPTAYPWDTEALTVVAVDDQNSTGSTIKVMIHRLCETAGLAANAATQHCSDGIDPNAGGGAKGGGSYGTGPPPTPTASPYYRVTTRVEGPRRTVSYTQVLMQ